MLNSLTYGTSDHNLIKLLFTFEGFMMGKYLFFDTFVMHSILYSGNT